MTQHEALTEAKRLFGDKAQIEIGRVVSGRMYYIHPTGKWSARFSGTGKTWVSALSSARWQMAEYNKTQKC